MAEIIPFERRFATTAEEVMHKTAVARARLWPIQRQIEHAMEQRFQSLVASLPTDIQQTRNELWEAVLRYDRMSNALETKPSQD